MNTVQIKGIEFSYQQLLNLLNLHCPFNKTFYYSSSDDRWFSVNHEDDNNLVIYKDVNDVIKSVEYYVDQYFMPLNKTNQVPEFLRYTMQVYFNDELITYYDADGEHEIPNDGSDVREQISRYLATH